MMVARDGRCATLPHLFTTGRRPTFHFSRTICASKPRLFRLLLPRAISLQKLFALLLAVSGTQWMDFFLLYCTVWRKMTHLCNDGCDAHIILMMRPNSNRRGDRVDLISDFNRNLAIFFLSNCAATMWKSFFKEHSPVAHNNAAATYTEYISTSSSSVMRICLLSTFQCHLAHTAHWAAHYIFGQQQQQRRLWKNHIWQELNIETFTAPLCNFMTVIRRRRRWSLLDKCTCFNF